MDIELFMYLSLQYINTTKTMLHLVQKHNRLYWSNE